LSERENESLQGRDRPNEKDRAIALIRTALLEKGSHAALAFFAAWLGMHT